MYMKTKVIPNALPSGLQHRLRLLDHAAINEFDRLEVISVRDGIQFIAIPQTFNGAKVVEIMLVVDTQNTGTFDWEVGVGATVTTGTFPASTGHQVTDISHTAATGDIIYVNVDTISGVQPVGLTLILTIIE